MRWPWQREQANTERVAFSLTQGAFAWAVLDLRRSSPSLARFGVQPLPVGDDEARARAVRALGLPAQDAIGVMPLADYQMLQIEAPAVPADELKSAARWRIKDMVSRHVDEVTLDVMHVGAALGPARQQLFVVAATNDALKATSQLAQAAGLQTGVIDIVDTAQRNLHTRAAARLDLADRATACLMLHGPHCLLTICIGDELYYSRRLDWEPGLPDVAARHVTAPAATELLRYEAVEATGLQWAGDALAYELGATEEPAEEATPRLVIELQRSFDVWERSSPDQPVAQLLLHTGQSSAALASYLQSVVGLRVQVLELAQVLPGAERGGDWDGTQRACLPLLGALLRQETVQR